MQKHDQFSQHILVKNHGNYNLQHKIVKEEKKMPTGKGFEHSSNCIHTTSINNSDGVQRVDTSELESIEVSLIISNLVYRLSCLLAKKLYYKSLSMLRNVWMKVNSKVRQKLNFSETRTSSG